MKRAMIIAAALALALSACGEDVAVGDDKLGGKYNIDKTATPTQKPRKTRTAAPKPVRTQPTAVKPTSNPKPFKHNIYTRGISYGYEPDLKNVYVGDIIIFKNLDQNSPYDRRKACSDCPQGHTFTSDKKNAKGKPLFDSGLVKYNGEWEFKVELEPGTYRWGCEIAPYMGSGSELTVLPYPGS